MAMQRLGNYPAIYDEEVAGLGWFCSGASADRRKYFLFFSDDGALPRRRNAHAAEGDDGGVQAFGHDAAGGGRNINANGLNA